MEKHRPSNVPPPPPPKVALAKNFLELKENEMRDIIKNLDKQRLHFKAGITAIEIRTDIDDHTKEKLIHQYAQACFLKLTHDMDKFKQKKNPEFAKEILGMTKYKMPIH